jgi:phosphinothricin acetyltransferase
MTHRFARRDDLPGIVAIYNSTVPLRNITADLEPVSVASREAWFDAHQADRRPLWVVERDGTVAAWLSFSDYYPRAAYARSAELSIYVHDAWRGHGIGAYLLDAAISHAPNISVDTLLGLIYAHNPRSLGLFASRRFERWGYLPGVCRVDDKDCDVVIVGRKV